jgi:type I restriction enzyme, S subunit
MSEWPMVQFHSLAADSKSAFSKPYGSAITKADYVPYGIPMVRGVNLRNGIFYDEEFVFITEDKANRMPGANLLPGDLVFTHRGTVGQVSMIPRKPTYSRYVLSTSQVKARLDPELALPEFYYYWFYSPEGRHSLLGNVSTVGVPGLAQPVATIKSLKVPRPSLAIQRSIATLLLTLDEKIAVNDQAARCCHKLAQAYLTQADDSRLLSRLSDIAALTMGSSPPGDTYNEDKSGMPFYQGTRDFGERYPARRVWCTSPIRVAQQGSTLVSVRAPVGRVNMAREQCCIGRGLASFASRWGAPSVLFHELVAASDVWKPYESEGTVFGAIGKSQIENLHIMALDERTARKLEDVLHPLDERVNATFDENKVLIELRDTLLPKLMSGEIRVREAEMIVEGLT